MNINIYDHIATGAASLTMGLLIGMLAYGLGSNSEVCTGLAILSSMACYPFMLEL